MYTEEEAKKKWCPMVQITDLKTGGLCNNREPSFHYHTTCIASECALWKWDENSRSETKTTCNDEVAIDYTRGCCGLIK